MQIKLNREDLLPRVKLLSGHCGRASKTLEVLSHIHCHIAGGTLTMRATNMESEIVTTLACEADGEGTFTMPAKKLDQMLGNLSPRSAVSLKIKGEETTVTAGSSRFILRGLKPSEYPMLKVEGLGNDVPVEAKKLSAALGVVSRAMAPENDIRYYLRGVAIQPNDGGMVLVATDGHRLAKWLIVMPTPEGKDIIMPSDSVRVIQSMLGGNVGIETASLNMGDRMFRFAIGDYTLNGKVLDGKFPEWPRVIPERTQWAKWERTAILGALRQLSPFVDDKTRGVLLQNEGGRVVCGTGDGSGRVETSLESAGLNGNFAANIGYLQEAVDLDCDPDVSFDDKPYSPVVVRSPDCVMVVMGMKQ